MNIRWKKGFAVLLSMGIVLTGFSQNAIYSQAEEQSSSEWELLKGKLDTYGGTWNQFDEAVNTVIPKTALMGNGDVGITSSGRDGEKEYLVSKGDFWNAGDLKTASPFTENEKARRMLTLGGITIKEDSAEGEKKNPSLTAGNLVSAAASSSHDKYYASQAIDQKLVFDDAGQLEGWVSAVGKEGWLQIDLGEVKKIEKYIIYHHGAVMESRAFRNTKDYTVSFSEDGNIWNQAEAVAGNDQSIRETVLEEPVNARYMKIEITEPNQNNEASPRCRIAEVEIFDDKDARSIFAKSEDLEERQIISEPEVDTDMQIGSTSLEIQTWLSATSNIMITKINSKSEESVSLDVSAWTKDDGLKSYKTESFAKENLVQSTRSTFNAAEDNELSWTSKAAIASKVLGADSVTAVKNSDAGSSLKFKLEPKKSVYIVTSVGGGGKTYNNKGELQKEDPLAQSEQLLNNIADESDIEELWEKHVNWWKKYWLKSYIDIGDEEYHRYYYGSLYYMGCTAREDKQAPGLYGLWVTTDNARYQNDYHMNYNYMAPFYGMYSSNRYESSYSLLQPVSDYLPEAEKAAKEELKQLNGNYISNRNDLADGIDDAVLYPVGLGPWGTFTESSYFGQTLNTLFAATLFMSYYNYSGDDQFLIKRAYPFLSKVANFYTKWCEKEELENGSYRYNLYDGAHEGTFNKNAGVSLGIAKSVYEFLTRNQEKGNASAEKLAEWNDMVQHLADIPVRTYKNGSFSKPVFALAEEGDDMIIWPGSASVNLEFVHPGDQLSFDSDPELLEIGRNTVEAKEVANSNIWDNINNNPKIFTHAIRVGYDPGYIMDKFRTYNIKKMEKNFTIQDGQHGIEKAGGIEFINNMLLQSSEGILKVFPNWTGADASFRNLREKGAYLVSADMSNGKVNLVEVVSETGNDVTIAAPWRNTYVADQAGKPVDTTAGKTKNTGEATITFQANAGDTYRMTGDDKEYADTALLEQILERIRELDGNQYTAESYAKAEEALAAAEELLDERPTVEQQEEIDQCIQKLVDAVCGLKEKEPEKIYADLKKLNNAVAKARSMNLESYTEISVNALKTLLIPAEKLVAAKPLQELQSVVDSMEAALGDAVKNLSPKETLADVSLLKQSVESVRKIKIESYTPDSWAEFAVALKTAEELLKENPSAERQQEVDRAIILLMDAVGALEEKKEDMPDPVTYADLTALNQAIKEAKSIDSRIYTEISVKALNTQLTAAQSLASQPIPGNLQHVADSMEQALRQAMNHLEKKEVPAAAGTTHPIGRLVYQVAKSAASGGEVLVKKAVKNTYTELTIPSYVNIGSFRFRVTGIGKGAFKGSKNLKKAVVGNAVLSVGKEAFAGCRKLEKVTLGTGVKTIGREAFKKDSRLRLIKIKALKLQKVGSKAFAGIHKKAVIDVPSKKVKAYKNICKGKGQKSSVRIK